MQKLSKGSKSKPISATVEIKAVPKQVTAVTKGFVLLARLALDGTEVPGSEFITSTKTYERTYEKLVNADKPTFTLKKKG